MTNSDPKQWKLTAITEALGNLELDINEKLTVGRGQDNDVVLGSKQVSRQHAELKVVGNELQIQDLGSSNGTLVNEVKLEPHQPKSLMADDVVTFAAFSFKVTQTEKTMAASETVSKVIAPEVVQPESVHLDAIQSESIQPESVSEPIESELIEAKIEQPEVVESTGVEPINNDVEPVITQVSEAVDSKVEPARTMDDKEDSEFEKIIAAERAEHQAEENAEAIEKSGIKTMTESELEKKLEEELEAPTGYHAPEHKHTHENDIEHFEELAAEADPDVHRAKQAAAAQMSATTNLHEKIETNSVTNDANMDTSVPEKHPSEALNTVNEQPQHNVAHVNNSAPVSNQPSSNKNSSVLWLALILVGLAVALWLYNSGTIA
ncbi:FHA domain-containing protein [Psychrobacter sp.]|uniref:FHA domain-containing protein n=1 Tax=Psychrobacter sp. TaxID=56811 RepID=UPI0025D0C551|nr:FHA domain-containing protein [Psychrobacter sp.]